MVGEKNITQRKLYFHAKNIRVYLPSLAHIHTSTHKPSHTQTHTHKHAHTQTHNKHAICI